MTACRPRTSTIPPMKLAASKVELWAGGGGVTGPVVELVTAATGERRSISHVWAVKDQAACLLLVLVGVGALVVRLVLWVGGAAVVALVPLVTAGSEATTDGFVFTRMFTLTSTGRKLPTSVTITKEAVFTGVGL